MTRIYRVLPVVAMLLAVFSSVLISLGLFLRRNRFGALFFTLRFPFDSLLREESVGIMIV